MRLDSLATFEGNNAVDIPARPSRREVKAMDCEVQTADWGAESQYGSRGSDRPNPHPHGWRDDLANELTYRHLWLGLAAIAFMVAVAIARPWLHGLIG